MSSLADSWILLPEIALRGHVSVGEIDDKSIREGGGSGIIYIGGPFEVFVNERIRYVRIHGSDMTDYQNLLLPCCCCKITGVVASANGGNEVAMND